MLRRLTNVVDGLGVRRIAEVSRAQPVVDRTVAALGRAATGGRLWIAIAAVLALMGRRGRRAAQHGVIGFAIAAGLANGPAKWIARRPRPHGLAVAGLGRLGRQPSTSSFPSSHTAAGFAFATAAGGAWPITAPLLGVAASGVALDRVRRARHFPTDVAAGAALGLLVGTATHLVLRRRLREDPDPDPDPDLTTPTET